MGADNRISYEVLAEQVEQRLDVYLAALFPETSRSRLRKLIEDGGVSVNGAVKKASYRMAVGDEVKVTWTGDKQVTLKPVDLDLEVLYEDDHIIVVNKPPGLMVHPGAGSQDPTLVEGLLYYLARHEQRLAATEDPLRPGVVHRLDQDTSGVIVCAKTETAYCSLAEQFKAKSNLREYVALVHGELKQPRIRIESYLHRDPYFRTRFASMTAEEFEKVYGESDRPKGYRWSVSEFRVLETYPWGLSFLACRLETGRTHQIRVHAKHLGIPILGDPLYRGNVELDRRLPKELGTAINGLNRQMLHARLLGFSHPVTNERLAFEANPPEDFQRMIKSIHSFCKINPN